MAALREIVPAPMTSQQEADDLLREWQEQRRRGIAAEYSSNTKLKISDGGATIHSADPSFVFFVFLVSLREELRARSASVARVQSAPARSREGRR
jgi:hypothetical protein